MLCGHSVIAPSHDWLLRSYQSEAAFQRAFKNHMGMTPAQWRKTQELTSADLFAVRQSSSKAAQ